VNHADTLMYDVEKQRKDKGARLSAEDKQTVQNETDAFKKGREGNNPADIKTAMDNFTQKVYAIFGKLYQQQGGQPGAGQPGPDMGGQQGANQQGPDAGTQNDDGSFNADGNVK